MSWGKMRLADLFSHEQQRVGNNFVTDESAFLPDANIKIGNVVFFRSLTNGMSLYELTVC